MLKSFCCKIYINNLFIFVLGVHLKEQHEGSLVHKVFGPHGFKLHGSRSFFGGF